MSETRFCQSCSMPMDSPDLLGTEKDGSNNQDYCKFCYRDGAFTNPDLTIEQMKARMIAKLDLEKLPKDILEAATSRLPHLKRWNSGVITNPK